MYHPLSDIGAPPAVYRRNAPPPPRTEPLTRRHVDVAVIGGGFTGLSAALHLAESGSRVAVLEAKHIGWGASGRAFGQVVPYLKPGQAEILRHYGPERGEHVIDAIGRGPDLVFDLIERHNMACWPVRTGLIFAAHSPSGERGLEERTRFWRARGADVDMVEGRALADLLGSSLYAAASIDRRGGNLNPFGYARGLAHAAVAAGAELHESAPVRGIRRENGRWLVDVGNDGLTADAVIIATNAYSTQLWPGLSESILPLRGHGFISEPLSDNLRRAILPERQSLTDTRQLFSGVRVLPDGRIHASGYGPILGPESIVNPAAVSERLRALFPALGDLRWTESWSGWVAMTADHFPRMHELAPGLFAGLGYNGRGIAAATLMGRDLALLVGGATDTRTVFPLTPLQPLPWRRAAPALARALVEVYRVRDAIDELRFRRARNSSHAR